MIYQDFRTLNKAYPNPREEMGFDEEVSFVEDCFDTYEAIGFCETFDTPYEDYAKYKGMTFTALGRVSYSKGEADIETLPMWHIKLENGKEIDAYPEEICKAERN